MDIRITGSDQLRVLARDLAAAGDGGQRFKMKLRRNMIGTTRPMVTEIQSGYRSASTHGDRHTGLRDALANATRLRIFMSAARAAVQLKVDPGRMPASQAGLPPLVENLRRWRKPLFGNTGAWFDQSPFPEFWPVVHRRIESVRIGVVAAAEETAAELERGNL